MSLFKKIGFLLAGIVVLFLVTNFGYSQYLKGKKGQTASSEAASKATELATFAGGCFWCTESDFEKVDGVLSVMSGYAGGSEVAPKYQEVASGQTGHREAVQVRFDPEVVTYRDLVDYHWRHFDPTDNTGSFVDRGFQYSGAVFCHTQTQCQIAEQSKADLILLNKFENPVVTPIIPYTTFYPAEDYHQDYYLKQPLKYKYYRFGSGRDQFLSSIWSNNQNQ